MKPPISWTLTIIAALVFSACGQKEQRGDPKTVVEQSAVQGGDDLMAQWHDVARMGHEDMDIGRAVQLTNQMAQQGREALEPILQVLGDPEESASAKMLAVICLTPFVDESNQDRFIELTESQYDSATRGCATHLLGVVKTEPAMRRAYELFDDSDPHVSKVAVLVFLRHGDEKAVERAVALWNNPDTPNRDRAEIMLGFPDLHALENIEMFKEAACMDGLETPARSRAIQLLGMMGRAEVLDALENCLEQETDLELRELIDAAIAAIRARDRDGIVAVPMSLPPGVQLAPPGGEMTESVP